MANCDFSLCGKFTLFILTVFKLAELSTLSIETPDATLGVMLFTQLAKYDNYPRLI